MNKFKYLALLPVISLAACGGGGSGDGTERDIAPVRPNAEVHGTGFDGLIIEGDVSVYGFSNAIKGDLLSTTTTDSIGRYAASLQSPDTPVLISIDGGFYVEEASGQQKQVDPVLRQKLMAVDYYESGSDIEVSATFFTTLATGLVEYLVHNQGLSTEVAIERAYAEIDAWAGFDTRRTTPLAVNDAANASPLLTNALRAGFVAAGISELTRVLGSNAGTEPHSTFYSIGFIQVAYEDIKADGILDGIGNGGDPLSYGTLLINSDTYRTLLSTRLLQFVNSDYNQTGLVFDDLVGYAEQLNLHAGELFNYVDSTDLANTLPAINNVTPSSETTLSSSVTVVASAMDIFGINSVEFLVDGQSVVTLTNAPYSFQLNTQNYQNGTYSLEVIATNFMGNVATLTNTITINNGDLSLTGGGSYISYMNDNDGCNYRYTVVDTTGEGASIIKVDESIKYIDTRIPSGTLTLSGNFAIRMGNSNPTCRMATVSIRSTLGMEYSYPIRVRKELTSFSMDKGFQFACRWDLAASC